MYTIFDFLHDFNEKQRCVSYIHGAVNPVTLLRLISDTQLPNMQCMVINADTAGKDIFFQLAHGSLFTNTQYVYIYGIEDLKLEYQKEWVLFLKNYQGIHIIVFFAKKLTHIHQLQYYEIPEYIDRVHFFMLADMYHCKYNRSIISELFDMLSREQSKVTFSLALDVMVYLPVLSVTLVKQFFLDYIPVLVQQEKSFFVLSDLFFTKNKKFFSMWNSIVGLYSMQFWIVFWSEQLFRAICYIKYMEMKKHDAAKKIGYRLPFSFLNKSWKHNQLDALVMLHQEFLLLDCNIKQGLSVDHINTILHRHIFNLK